MRVSDNDFIKELKKQLLELLGEGYDTKVQKAVKNNGIVQDGNYFMEFEQIKGKVAYKLVNTKANMELLQSIPHFEFLDLSIIFYLYLNDGRYGGMTAVIHNQHLDVWGITSGELYNLAKNNTPVLFPAEIRTMCDVLKRYVKDQAKDDEKETKEIQEVLNQIKDENVKVPFHILSNRIGVNGACSILYHNALKNFADKDKTDLAILPSSVHEVLLLPCNDKTDFMELKALVKCTNQMEVRMKDWLSDTVYYYRRRDDRIFEADSLKL